MPDDDAPGWLPLNVRDSQVVEEYSALAEGLPGWLENSVWRWAMDRAVRTGDMAHRVERLLRIKLPPADGRNVFDDYWQSASADERLTLVDFFIHDLQEVHDANADKFNQTQVNRRRDAIRAAARLAQMLQEGGSVWRVVTNPHWALARRVNEASQALVDVASSPATDAARKIASAWNACYKHGPDYDRAYRDAVLAVEAVALPLALPNDERGTLGKVVAHIAQTGERWTVGGLDATEQRSGDTLVAMLRTLWHNQERHARRDGTIGDVSRDEAETAVALAVTLVHWFSSGLVKRIE